MKFNSTPLAGAYLIEPEPRSDDRGHFARVFCVEEFGDQGLCMEWKQSNAAFSKYRGTTRGLHYQLEPHSETKLARCTRGAVFDVMVDMRPDSPSYKQWFGAELSESNQQMLYVPAGFAHGYQVLQDNSELTYMVSALYAPEAEAGVRWDDPAVGIDWPIKDDVALSEKDTQWSLLD